ELGRRLFNDRRLSADGTVSCAGCHQAGKAFTDGLKVALGTGRQQGLRNTPTVINAGYFDTLFTDGRAGSLEDQALGPLFNPLEHGLSSHDEAVEIIRSDPDYRQRFRQAFDATPSAITIALAVKAIASYERTLVSGNSPFDRYFFAGERGALSDPAARGLRIFRRKGNCANCHEISWNNALFTDKRFYNIGVGFKRIEPRIGDFLAALARGLPPERFEFAGGSRSELGRFNVTGYQSDIGRFKTPTLRNIALTGPYMHDGSFSTLREVVEYYNKGGEKNPFLDPAIFPLHLTEQEIDDLVEFLENLTGPEFSESD
ncbi:MAG: cytochrome-c peroxidase, partial [Gammaproteobacteria bacterium]